MHMNYRGMKHKNPTISPIHHRLGQLCGLLLRVRELPRDQPGRPFPGIHAYFHHLGVHVNRFASDGVDLKVVSHDQAQVVEGTLGHHVQGRGWCGRYGQG